MDEDSAQAFNELQRSGLLWLINRVCFHPRGMALALHTDDDGNAHGWSLNPSPDGAVWSFPADTDADGYARAEATIAAAREETPRGR